MKIQPVHKASCHCGAVQYGFNVACLEGVNPFELKNIPTYDGVNHPADNN